MNHLVGWISVAVSLRTAIALTSGSDTMKAFLVNNTRENDLVMFADMAGDDKYESSEEVPLSVLLPAFITSELKTAFQIGFLLFLPRFNLCFFFRCLLLVFLAQFLLRLD